MAHRRLGRAGQCPFFRGIVTGLRAGLAIRTSCTVTYMYNRLQFASGRMTLICHHGTAVVVMSSYSSTPRPCGGCEGGSLRWAGVQVGPPGTAPASRPSVDQDHRREAGEASEPSVIDLRLY